MSGLVEDKECHGGVRYLVRNCFIPLLRAGIVESLPK
jgi:hypothetical protein